MRNGRQESLIKRARSKCACFNCQYFTAATNRISIHNKAGSAHH